MPKPHEARGAHHNPDSDVPSETHAPELLEKWKDEMLAGAEDVSGVPTGTRETS